MYEQSLFLTDSSEEAIPAFAHATGLWGGYADADRCDGVVIAHRCA